MSVSMNFARACVLPIAVMSCLMAPPVLAQTQNETRAPSAQEDCALKSQDGQDSAGSNGQSGSDGQGLSGKLEDCDGVLKPPKTGDPELVKPAPNKGVTPVIPPKALPDKQQENDSDAQ